MLREERGDTNDGYIWASCGVGAGIMAALRGTHCIGMVVHRAGWRVLIFVHAIIGSKYEFYDQD